MASESTLVVGQRHESFPNRDAHGEIQHVSENWVTLWARWMRESRFLPLPNENEDRNAKHQRIEHRSVEHDDNGRTQGRRAGSYMSQLLRNTTIRVTRSWAVRVRQLRRRPPVHTGGDYEYWHRELGESRFLPPIRF